MSALAVGSFRIQLVHAGIQWWDAGGFFGVVPKTLWSKRMACDDIIVSASPVTAALWKPAGILC